MAIPRPQKSGGNDFLVEIRNAEVYLRQTRVLDAIDWTMKQNENWAVVGNNGSGKTTFMKLIFGELIPLHGGRAAWFGQRGRPIIRELRKRIGFVSAEYQQGYDHNITGLEVVASGFFSSIGIYDAISTTQKSAAREWMKFFGVGHLADRGFRRLSYGEARRVLLARALVTRPRLLILDEPCNGLDIPTREAVLQTIEKLSRTETRLIYVTHHIDEIVPGITHVLYLKNGRIQGQGPKETLLRDGPLSAALDCRVRVEQNGGRYWITQCGPPPR